MQTKEDEYFFQKPNGGRLTRDRLEKRIKTLAKKIGAPGGLHAWRRACLTNYANSGAPIHMLQKIAGHSDIKTTMSYIRPDIEEVINSQRDW
jgi:integrase